MRIGGFCASMVRICTGEVWVRRSFGWLPSPALQEKRVVHLTRRMAFREIQRGEIVVIGLDVRPFGDRKAHVGEDRGDLVDHLADRVDAAALGRRLPHRQRHVDLFGGEPRGDGDVACSSALRAASASVTRFFSPLIAGPFDLPFFSAHRAKRLQHFGDRALLAECRHAHRLDRLFVAGCGDFGEKRFSRTSRFPAAASTAKLFRSRRPVTKLVSVSPFLVILSSKKNPRQPCQRGFPKSDFRMLGKRGWP